MSHAIIPTDTRVELYLRGDTYGTYEAQQDVLDRVRSLEERGALDGADVSNWARRVRTRAGDSREEALATVERFEAWAEANDYGLEPGFERRERASLLGECAEEVVTFPVVCLAVHRGDALQAVFPCSDGERTYTVGDCLDAFERGEDGWLDRFERVGGEAENGRLETTTVG